MRCRRIFDGVLCDGEMKPGQALANKDLVFSPDFLGESPSQGCTANIDTTQSTMINVMKCEKCGHSLSLRPKESHHEH